MYPPWRPGRELEGKERPGVDFVPLILHPSTPPPLHPLPSVTSAGYREPIPTAYKFTHEWKDKRLAWEKDGKKKGTGGLGGGGLGGAASQAAVKRPEII